VKAASETVPADLSGFTHLILSGSTWSILDDRPELRAAEALVRQAVLRGVPVLGICYGHQLLARALLGRGHVGRAPVPEMGWLPIRWDESESGWFHPLPNPFRVFVGHHDEVRDLPEDWRVIARSGQCANHGMVNERLRVLGFQFHPEMDLETGNACYEADRDALTRDGFDVDAILRDALDDGAGAVLIPRFLERWPAAGRSPSSGGSPVPRERSPGRRDQRKR
jgi:GMP synthase (glutamine-hydrolysing)